MDYKVFQLSARRALKTKIEMEQRHTFAAEEKQRNQIKTKYAIAEHVVWVPYAWVCVCGVMGLVW